MNDVPTEAPNKDRDDYNPLEHPDVVWVEVAVDYNRTKQEVLEALKATGRKILLYIDDAVLAAAPQHGKGVVEKRVPILPFSAIPNRYRATDKHILNRDLQVLLKDYDLVWQDLHTVGAVSENYPYLVYPHPYSTQFKDQNGVLCEAAFVVWDGKRMVVFSQPVPDPDFHCWFFVSRKEPLHVG